MKAFFQRIAREPAIITSVVVSLLSLFAVRQETQDMVITILTALLPLIGGLVIRSQVTPVSSPNLGDSNDVPEDLRRAALAVAQYLPAPIGVLVQQVGIPGLELAVKVAQNAARRAPTVEESADHVKAKL